MAAAKGEGYGRAPLGVLEHPAEDRAGAVREALEYLSGCGLGAPRRGLCNALALGLVHSSYYHEHTAEIPGLTRATLDALYRLGSAFLQKAAAEDVYRGSANPTSASMSQDVAGITSAVPDWAAQQQWIRRSAALGVGLARDGLSPKVAGILLRQTIGVLCLAGEQAVAAALLSDVLAAGRRKVAQSVTDPRTLLQQQVGHDAVTYRYEHEGPDHDAVFRAVVTGPNGRRGQGTGRSKRAAAHQASLDFLTRHIPQALSVRREDAEPRRPAREVAVSAPHIQAVDRVQELFSLPGQARPLLSQALVHASWAYENPAVLNRYHQQDYQALAFLGSQILIYEYFLAAAQHLVVDPPEEFAFGHVPNETFDLAFRQAGLSSGLLLGAGQAALGIPAEMGSDAFQAVIAAISVAQGFPDTLAHGWPAPWAALWQLIAPTSPRTIDPTSHLGRVGSALKLQVGYEFQGSGADHQRRYAATVVLDSDALGLSMRTEGAPTVGKTPAKHQVSLAVLGVLDRLADQSPARSLDGADERDRSLARTLLAQQAAVLAKSSVPVQRWAGMRLFGFHLVSDPAALIRWAVGVDELLGPDATAHPGGLLRNAFRSAVEASADPDRTLDVALARAMDTLEGFEEPEDVTPSYLRHLVRLCDVYRCLGAEDPDVLVSQLLDDWRILHRGRLKMLTPWPEARLSGRERAVLDAAVTTVLETGKDTSVEVLGDRPLHARFRSVEPAPRAVIDEVRALWSKVSGTTTIETTDNGIDVIVNTTRTPAEPGPITRAVVDALRPGSEPYRAAVADLLHDLKNQLVAARLAAAQPAEGRTARLQQQLTASRHLDEAQSLAVRVRAATSLLTPVSTESVELGGFLRQYAATVLTRLPGNISLTVPEARRPVHVALEARALKAVLDNLVGNASEALREGGAITLAWTADEYEAVVEITDNGPGLPEEVATALASGERVRSTKPGGNGLGLLGVRSLLAQVGGQLSLAAVPSGTTWFITLPTATPTTWESA